MVIDKEPWDVRRNKKFEKIIARFPKHDAERIQEHFSDVDFNPYEGDIRKLQGEENIWSIRLGEYRAFYEIYQEEHMAEVFHVERRNTQTYKRGKQKR